jgi:HNH endonuclease
LKSCHAASLFFLPSEVFPNAYETRSLFSERFVMVREIALTRGHVALVDEDLYEWLATFSWHVHMNGRQVRAQCSVWDKNSRKWQRVLMHRMILQAAPGQIVDHINGDTLDNRVANLRFATAAQNARNHAPRGKSGHNGVRKSSGAWAAMISPGGREISLGVYDTPEKAAAAYNAAAVVVYQQFARLNDVEPIDGILEQVIAAKRGAIDRLREEIDILCGGKHAD